MIWYKKTLGEIYAIEGGSVQTGPFGSQLHESDYKEFGVPVIMPKDIKNDKLDLTNIAHISDEDAKRLSQHIVKVGDIICPRRGEIGKRIIIEEGNVGAFCGTGCIRLRGTGLELNQLFFFYFLQQPNVVNWIENQAVGSTMMNLNTSIIKSIPVKYPPLPIQQKIASILSAYDELIENNKQRIKLLEEMAEEIYKEWFVRLRFPNYENTEFVDGLPLGWEIKAFDDVAEYINGFAFKPTDWYDSGLPIIKISELKNGVSESTPRNNGDIVPLKLHVKQGELLFSWSADLNVYIWNNGKGLLNQHIFKVVPFEIISKEYLFFCLKHHMATFKNKSNGATMHHIRRSALGEVFLFLPNVDLVERFTSITSPILSEVGILSQKNQLLQQTRDLLLPRLISGKLSVAGLLEDNVYKIGENEGRLSMAAEDGNLYGIT